MIPMDLSKMKLMSVINGSVNMSVNQKNELQNQNNGAQSNQNNINQGIKLNPHGFQNIGIYKDNPYSKEEIKSNLLNAHTVKKNQNFQNQMNIGINMQNVVKKCQEFSPENIVKKSIHSTKNEATRNFFSARKTSQQENRFELIGNLEVSQYPYQNLERSHQFFTKNRQNSQIVCQTEEDEYSQNQYLQNNLYRKDYYQNLRNSYAMYNPQYYTFDEHHEHNSKYEVQIQNTPQIQDTNQSPGRNLSKYLNKQTIFEGKQAFAHPSPINQKYHLDKQKSPDNVQKQHVLIKNKIFQGLIQNTDSIDNNKFIQEYLEILKRKKSKVQQPKDLIQKESQSQHLQYQEHVIGQKGDYLPIEQEYNYFEKQKRFSSDHINLMRGNQSQINSNQQRLNQNYVDNAQVLSSPNRKKLSRVPQLDFKNIQYERESIPTGKEALTTRQQITKSNKLAGFFRQSSLEDNDNFGKLKGKFGLNYLLKGQNEQSPLLSQRTSFAPGTDQCPLEGLKSVQVINQKRNSLNTNSTLTNYEKSKLEQNSLAPQNESTNKLHQVDGIEQKQAYSQFSQNNLHREFIIKQSFSPEMYQKAIHYIENKKNMPFKQENIISKNSNSLALIIPQKIKQKDTQQSLYIASPAVMEGGFTLQDKKYRPSEYLHSPKQQKKGSFCAQTQSSFFINSHYDSQQNLNSLGLSIGDDQKQTDHEDVSYRVNDMLTISNLNKDPVWGQVNLKLNLSTMEVLAVKFFPMQENRFLEIELPELRFWNKRFKNCENLVQIHQIVPNSPEGHCSIIMKYLSGGTLKGLLQKFICLNTVQLKELALGVLKGLKQFYQFKEDEAYEGLCPSQIFFDSLGRVSLGVSMKNRQCDLSRDDFVNDAQDILSCVEQIQKSSKTLVSSQWIPNTPKNNQINNSGKVLNPIASQKYMQMLNISSNRESYGSSAQNSISLMGKSNNQSLNHAKKVKSQLTPNGRFGDQASVVQSGSLNKQPSTNSIYSHQLQKQRKYFQDQNQGIAAQCYSGIQPIQKKKYSLTPRSSSFNNFEQESNSAMIGYQGGMAKEGQFEHYEISLNYLKNKNLKKLKNSIVQKNYQNKRCQTESNDTDYLFAEPVPSISNFGSSQNISSIKQSVSSTQSSSNLNNVLQPKPSSAKNSARQSKYKRPTLVINDFESSTQGKRSSHPSSPNMISKEQFLLCSPVNRQQKNIKEGSSKGIQQPNTTQNNDGQRKQKQNVNNISENAQEEEIDNQSKKNLKDKEKSPVSTIYGNSKNKFYAKQNDVFSLGLLLLVSATGVPLSDISLELKSIKMLNFNNNDELLSTEDSSQIQPLSPRENQININSYNLIPPVPDFKSFSNSGSIRNCCLLHFLMERHSTTSHPSSSCSSNFFNPTIAMIHQYFNKNSEKQEEIKELQNFLCTCLQFEENQRFDAEDAVNHQYFLGFIPNNEHGQSLTNIKEILNVCQKIRLFQENNSLNVRESQLVMLCQSIRKIIPSSQQWASQFSSEQLQEAQVKINDKLKQNSDTVLTLSQEFGLPQSMVSFQLQEAISDAFNLLLKSI